MAIKDSWPTHLHPLHSAALAISFYFLKVFLSLSPLKLILFPCHKQAQNVPHAPSTARYCVHLSFGLGILLLFASPVPFVTALWQQNIFTCYPVTLIWSPISFYSINIFSALVPGESSADSVINGSPIMGPHYPACLGCESMESCCGFCCFWVFAVDSLTPEIQPRHCADC